MKTILIEGNRALHGHVHVSGAKNAALPLLFATLLTRDVSIFHALPHIRDVDIVLGLLEELGGIVLFEGDMCQIDTRPIKDALCTSPMAKQLRGSLYLLGAGLGQFGHAFCSMPGGCDLGVRPIDQHLKAFEALGGIAHITPNGIEITAEQLKGADISFDVVSVGATINAMLAATKAQGKTILRGVSKEPYVLDVAQFINACGGCVRGAGSDVIEIDGVTELHGAEFHISPDMMEAGTYLLWGVATGGEVSISPVRTDDLSALIDALHLMGVEMKIGKGSITTYATSHIRPISLCTMPFPGFPTDLHPQLSALLCKAEGESHIEECVWPNRFQYASQLARAGGVFSRYDNSIYIHGQPSFHGAVMEAPDLRAGAAVLTMALMAKGISVIEGVDVILRGYENVVGKLRGLGANIFLRAGAS